MKRIYLFYLLLFISALGFAQVQDDSLLKELEQEEPEAYQSKLYYGGYLSLSLGNYTVVGATPLIGYKVSQKFSVGTQLSYEYVKDKRYNANYETSNYGLSVFSRYRIVPQLYAHVEFSEMNYKFYYTNGSNAREWVPFLWLGGGYSQPISRNTWFNVQVLFDVLNNENSPYTEWEPYFSVGFGVGF
jgi:hypothetical protein